MASSQLKSEGQNPAEGHSDPGKGSVFPFAWRSPAIQGSDTVITAPNSVPVPVPAEVFADANHDHTRRLFPTVVEDEDVAGIRIGHFTIQKRIGLGGMGSVFLATDEDLRRNVALKILAPSLSVDPSSVQRFQNEARAAARLDHDNIARVFLYGSDAGLHYIAYEYVAGSNLRDVIRQKGKLDPAEAVNYTMQLAAALSHTSAAGVVHRDIKPSNILITPQRRAKLVDLGLARRDSADVSVELTVAGTTLGTFDYISPEQAKDPRNVDVRSDIYSLGCTLYHMLTGEPPYPEGTVLQKLLDHQGKDVPDPARRNRRVSPALSAVVRRMMSPEPRRRYANPGELLRDLLIVARSLGSGAVPIDGQVWLTASRFQPPVWQRNIGWVATAAALGLLVFSMERFPTFAQRFDVRPRRVIHEPLPESPTTRIPETNIASASGSAGGMTQPSGTSSKAKPGENRSDVDEPIVGVAQGPRLDPAESLEPGERILQPIPLDLKPVDGMFDTQDLALLSSASNTKTIGGESASASKPRSPSSDSHLDEHPTESVPVKSIPSNSNDVPTSSTSAESGLVVSVLDGKSYLSLEAACAEAKDGSIIELRYNGSRGELERPIRVAGRKSITVRGGIGFFPVVAFAPTEQPTEASQSRMVTVTGSSLELVNLELQLTVPERITSDRWALFSLERPEKLQLHGVTITVVNPSNQSACVIEQAAATGQGLGNVGMMKNGMPAEPPRVSISECLIRGESDLIVLRDAVPVRFQVKDALIGLSGAFFHAICQTELTNAETDRVSLELDHTTCLLRESLIVTEGAGSFTDRTPPVLVVANNNIVSCGPNKPLILMKDASDLMDTQRQFVWKGDRNYYDSQTVFWQLGGRQSVAMARQLDFDAWRNYWGGNEGTGSSNSAVIWRNRVSDNSWTKLTREDAELNTMSANNPALNGASDGSNAGVMLGKLPVPVEPERSNNAAEMPEDVE